jgi:uroporphyrinogen-III synthase
LTILPPEQDELLVVETDAMLAARPSYAIVSTASGLAAWLAALDSGRRAKVTALLQSVPVLARGSKAAGGLHSVSVRAEFVSPVETTDDVALWLAPRLRDGDTVAAQVHGGEVLGSFDGIRRRGATVHTVAPYRWALPQDLRPARSLIAALIGGRVDVLACTSAPAVRNLFAFADAEAAGDELRQALRDSVTVAAVGPVTAQAFEIEGVGVSIMPTRARTGDLVRAVAAFAERDDEVAGPLELVPSARAVRIGAGIVVLGAQEFDVLAALVRRPGVVCKPGTLSLAAFGHALPEDATAIRHHVSRIRRKLGQNANLIETVRGVGYRYRPSA